MNTAAAHPLLEARLRTEAGVLARLEHPGVVPIHDLGRLPDGRLFYAMRLVRGVTLAEHLATLPELADRLRVFERVCEPVAYAHAHGVVPRDLKPANVMVGEFGTVLVMDWGVAKVLGDPELPAMLASGAAGGTTDPGTVLGTPGFMAPEQAGGWSARTDQRSDVYALGAILSLVLAGSARLPKRLRAIGHKALATDPARRYADAGALAADIAHYRLGQPVAAYPETVLDRVARFAATHRTAILLVLAYLVMRAIVALVFPRPG
jgi:serine/threonine protein kinase